MLPSDESLGYYLSPSGLLHSRGFKVFRLDVSRRKRCSHASDSTATVRNPSHGE
jgi:hypothetical protein